MEAGQARLVILGENSSQDQVHDACVEDIREFGCCARTVAAVSPGRVVRVDYQDRMLLGECLACSPDEGAFRIDVRFHSALNSVTDLAALIRALLEEQQNSREHRSSTR